MHNISLRGETAVDGPESHYSNDTKDHNNGALKNEVMSKGGLQTVDVESSRKRHCLSQVSQPRIGRKGN
jgi:hypothetical protein